MQISQGKIMLAFQKRKLQKVQNCITHGLRELSYNSIIKNSIIEAKRAKKKSVEVGRR